MAIPIPQPGVQFCDPETGLIAPAWYDYFKSRDRVSSGVGGGSSTAVWYYGASSTPSNSLGLDGDFYMILSGGAIGGVRIKQGGVWV